MDARSAIENVGTWPLEWLEAEIHQGACDLAAAQCRWLLLVGEFDRREGWATWGCRSCAEWLSWQCGLSPVTGREHVRVAHCVERFEATRELFAAGRLSYSKVRALSRVLTEANEATLLGYAREATAGQLERLVRVYKPVRDDAALGPEEGRQARRHVSWRWDDDGMLVIEGRLEADEGALLLAALEVGADELHPPAGRRGTDSAESPGGDDDSAESSGDKAGAPLEARPARAGGGAMWADALGVLAETTLAHGPTPQPGSARYQVLVHLDLDTLQTGDDDPQGRAAAHIHNGPHLPTSTAKRIACDCGLRAVVEGGREHTLEMGRLSRRATDRQRLALIARYGGCDWPGCQATRFIDAHHIVPWEEGGATDIDNLLPHCRRHHTFIHDNGIVIRRGAHGRTGYSWPDGREITTPDIDGPPHPLPASGGDLRADTGPGWFDINQAIWGLLDDEGLPIG